MSDLYAVCEVAEYLKLSYWTVLKYIRSGDLKAAKLGGEYRVSKRDLNKFVQSQRYNPTDYS